MKTILGFDAIEVVIKKGYLLIQQESPEAENGFNVIAIPSIFADTLIRAIRDEINDENKQNAGDSSQ